MCESNHCVCTWRRTEVRKSSLSIASKKHFTHINRPSHLTTKAAPSFRSTQTAAARQPSCSGSSACPLAPCNGGREKALTVELPLRISRSDLSAATVLFMYVLSMSSISSSSRTSPPPLANEEPAASTGLSSPSLSSLPSSLGGAGGWLLGSSCSSIASHSFTSLYRRSVVKKGSCITFWMKGSRISAPVLLSYFLRILTSPG
jgi:hypothetical protein